MFNLNLTQVYNTFGEETFGWQSIDALAHVILVPPDILAESSYNLTLVPLGQGIFYLNRLEVTPIGLDRISNPSTITSFQINSSSNAIKLDDLSASTYGDPGDGESITGNIGADELGNIGFITASNDPILYNSLLNAFKKLESVVEPGKKIMELMGYQDEVVHVGYSDSFNEFGYGYFNIIICPEHKKNEVNLWCYTGPEGKHKFYEGDLGNRIEITNRFNKQNADNLVQELMKVRELTNSLI